MAHKHLPVFRVLLANLMLLTSYLAADVGLAATRLASGAATAPQSGAGTHGGSLIIENAGQWPDAPGAGQAPRFQVWGGGPTLWLAEDALWLSVVAGSQVEGTRFDPVRVPGSRLGERNLEPATLNGVNVRLSFPGANPHPRLEPFARQETHVSYFLGNDPAGWRPAVPVWGGVRYVDLYPGIDLVVGAGVAGTDPALDGGRPQGSPLPWRLEARAGADLAALRLRVEGADAVTVEGDALRLGTAAGEVRVPLLAVEGVNVQRAHVERVNGSAFDVIAPFATTHVGEQPARAEGQELAAASQRAALLLYSTFLGGSSSDRGEAIAVNGMGNAYLAGSTYSGDFPTTPGVSAHGSRGRDAFTAKLDRSGSGLAYVAFLRSASGSDAQANAIAADAAGNAYLTGEWGDQAFAVKLGPEGDALSYVAHLSGWGSGMGIAVDKSGAAYVTGVTFVDIEATPGAFDTSFNGYADAFVVKLDPAGRRVYATHLGGTSWDSGLGIAVDEAGYAYVTGDTTGRGFPSTPDAFDPSYHNGGYVADAFVVKLDPTGSTLVYGTFLGSEGYEGGRAIAVDAAGCAYVAGETGPTFPVTAGAFDTSFNGWGDVFVAKLNPAGNRLLYATFLGGDGDDRGYGLAVDPAGNAYVTGFTESGDFPTTPGAFDTSFGGRPYSSSDAFAATLDPTGSFLTNATYLGGERDDIGAAIAVDAAGHTYVTGETESDDFPTTPGAFDPSYNGIVDVFVAKLLTGSSVWGTIWRDLDGDATRDAGEPILTGVQVCAEPLGHGPLRCAISEGDGSYVIGIDAAGTYPVAPSPAPAGMRLTTPGFRLPVVVREGEQVRDIDFGYR